MEIIFSEIETAGDVKDFVSTASDMPYDDDKIKEQIFSFDDCDLIKVTKTIASPIKIIKVDKVDEQYIEKNL